MRVPYYNTYFSPPLQSVERTVSLFRVLDFFSCRLHWDHRVAGQSTTRVQYSNRLSHVPYIICSNSPDFSLFWMKSVHNICTLQSTVDIELSFAISCLASTILHSRLINLVRLSASAVVNFSAAFTMHSIGVVNIDVRIQFRYGVRTREVRQALGAKGVTLCRYFNTYDVKRTRAMRAPTL